MIIDIASPVGMLRYRCGDFLDGAQQLPDEVYESALAEKNGNMQKAAILCCQYILAGLAFGTHQKLGIIETWGSEAFENYKSYLMLVIKDPAFSSVSPIPYSGDNGLTPIIEFKKHWDREYDCHRHLHRGWVEV